MSRTTGQKFAQSYVELHKVQAVDFGLLNSDEVARMSVVKIENERIYDERGTPVFGGINDPRMGTMDKEHRCMTCRMTQAECPGHFGHIELIRPVYHAGLIEYIRKLLRCVCFHCSRLLIPKDDDTEERILASIRRTKNSQSRFNKVLRICETISKCDPQKGCGYSKPKFTKSGLRIMVLYTDTTNLDPGRDRQQILWPNEVYDVLRRINDDDCFLLGFRPENSRPENMIIKNLAVAPPPVRPSVAMSSSNRSEDDLTFAYQMILKTNNQLKTQTDRGANPTVLNELRASLQYYVATLMDNEIQGQPTHRQKSGKPIKAIRARLRGKEGRLRGNLMGKRVDFSSRSVITPDPILQLDQLGVPQQIASTLTVPETVTSDNIEEMKRLVLNGPNNWPGAKYIIRHDGKQIDLASLKSRSDAHVEIGYIVERHLKNNDYVIFNRQPSLHKMSLMGHRVKVLPYSTFRLNLSVTTPYNADFDGDEMNMHVPQSYETMAEVKEIMAVPNQIVSPKDNKPVMGIVQDSLLGVMLFTNKDTFIEKELVMNLLMWANYEDNKLPTPAILKPKPLWTGKQIFSLIIPKINLENLPKNFKGWNNVNDEAKKRDNVILIKNSELLCGNLTKGTIGSSSGGMIHIIWKEKGPYACRDFLSNTQLLINNWLHQNGFTVGVQDIIANKSTLDKIRETLTKNTLKANEVLQKAQIGTLSQLPGKNMMETFEFEINKILNEARDFSGKAALADLYSWNRLKAMVTAGSKGSDLNISQIMACVGQQNVEGKRIPFGFHQRTLPHFSKDDFGPESRGFVENCYLSGLTPQEFFFHAMGGREGLIDTAVKTAETGYIQRRLIKALEDVMVKYDGTVRTSKQQIIQFLYGEDGMAGENIEDLKIELKELGNAELNKRCNFLHGDRHTQEFSLSMAMGQARARQILDDPQMTLQLREEFAQLQKDREDLRTIILKKYDDNEPHHLGVNVPRILVNAKEEFMIKPNSETDLNPSYVLQRLKNLSNELTAIPGVSIRADPLILQANENSTWLFNIYLRSLLCSKNVILSERLNQRAFDWVIGEIKSRFEQAIVNPGEMIGPIAAQSIGEPATQMTLNTFHQAGVSSKNVTLGVPRLKEIINVAKNIKTPSMKIYLKDEHKHDEEYATKFGAKIEYTTLNHILKSSSIYYDPDPQNTIIPIDQDVLNLYSEVAPDFDRNNGQQPSKWVMRFLLDNHKVAYKDIYMEQIEEKIGSYFQDQYEIRCSNVNQEHLVLRLRLSDGSIDDIDEDEEQTPCMMLKENMDRLANEMILKGFSEITKVSFSKYLENEYDKDSGLAVPKPKNEEEEKERNCWLIETDGVALQKVLGFSDQINYKKTTSNDIQEILKVLGIEAVRISLINELRFVLRSYGIYVNYRHLSTLCDVMTQRGILTSITRHGINRVDSGPLRKCSFEETVEILYEAAVFGEIDHLSGITENIVMGQLAPCGTGAFDLIVDQSVLNEYAQTRPDEDSMDDISNQQTPMQDEYFNQNMSTPINTYTPNNGLYNYSERQTPGATPAYAGDMSPGPGLGYGGTSQHGMMSPSSSMTPYGGRSPIFQPYQSPIYQAQNTTIGGMKSPQHHISSPSYSPTNSRVSPMYGSNPLGYNGSSQSPAQFSSSGGPAYVTSGGSSQNQHASHSYSPTTYVNPASPRYSAQSPNYARGIGSSGQQYSPQYSPTTHGASPRYSVPQTRYNVNSALGSSHSPSASAGNSSMYIPNSPRYNVAASSSPPGGPVRPNPAYNGGSPIGDSDSDDVGTPK